MLRQADTTRRVDSQIEWLTIKCEVIPLSQRGHWSGMYMYKYCRSTIKESCHPQTRNYLEFKPCCCSTINNGTPTMTAWISDVLWRSLYKLRQCLYVELVEVMFNCFSSRRCQVCTSRWKKYLKFCKFTEICQKEQ